MTNFIIQSLVIVLLVLQIVVIIYTLVCQIKRNKEDKKFWEAMDEAIRQQVDRYNDLYPDEPLKLEEDTTSEQDE